MKILVADDSGVTRLIISSLLARWGFEVVQAADGGEACQQLESEDGPSLALLDWQMPKMDGTEVCRKLRQNASARPVYIVLLTAKDSPGDLAQGMAAGADDYLIKPFETDELQVRVRVGARVVELQQKLAQRENELASLQTELKQLRGPLEKEAACGL